MVNRKRLAGVRWRLVGVAQRVVLTESLRNKRKTKPRSLKAARSNTITWAAEHILRPHRCVRRPSLVVAGGSGLHALAGVFVGAVVGPCRRSRGIGGLCLAGRRRGGRQVLRGRGCGGQPRGLDLRMAPCESSDTDTAVTQLDTQAPPSAMLCLSLWVVPQGCIRRGGV